MLRVAGRFFRRLVRSRSTLSAPVRSPIWTALTTWMFAVLLPSIFIFEGFYTLSSHQVNKSALFFKTLYVLNRVFAVLWVVELTP